MHDGYTKLIGFLNFVKHCDWFNLYQLQWRTLKNEKKYVELNLRTILKNEKKYVELNLCQILKIINHFSFLVSSLSSKYKTTIINNILEHKYIKYMNS